MSRRMITVNYLVENKICESKHAAYFGRDVHLTVQYDMMKSVSDWCQTGLKWRVEKGGVPLLFYPSKDAAVRASQSMSGTSDK